MIKLTYMLWYEVWQSGTLDRVGHWTVGYVNIINKYKFNYLYIIITNHWF